MVDTRRVKPKRPWVTDVGIVAAVAIVGLLGWGWIAGVRSPGRDATLLLLARGPADGADVYYRHGDEYEPSDKEKEKVWTSLTAQDLVVAHIPSQNAKQGGQSQARGQWAHTWGVALWPDFARTKLKYTATRIRDLVPVRLDALMGTAANMKEPRTRFFSPFRHYSYEVAQYDTERGSVVSLMVDGFVCQHCMYSLDEDNTVEWMFCGEYGPTLYLFFPGLRVVPECRGAQGVPDIVAFQPLVGLVCRRWDGERFRPALPRLREVPLMIGRLRQGYIWWLSVLVALTPVYLLGLRHVMARGNALALLAWWGILLVVGCVTSFLLSGWFGAIMLGVLAALGVWIVGTYRQREVSLGRLCLSVVLGSACSVALLFWLVVVYGYFEVHGIGVP